MTRGPQPSSEGQGGRGRPGEGTGRVALQEGKPLSAV